jgi:hypothetical protein
MTPIHYAVEDGAIVHPIILPVHKFECGFLDQLPDYLN